MYGWGNGADGCGGGVRSGIVGGGDVGTLADPCSPGSGTNGFAGLC